MASTRANPGVPALKKAEPPFVLKSNSPKVNMVTGRYILSNLKQLKAFYKTCSDEERLVFLTSALTRLPPEQKEKIKDLFLDDEEVSDAVDINHAPTAANAPGPHTDAAPATVPPSPGRLSQGQPASRLQTEAEKQAYIHKKLKQIELESRADEPNIRKQLWGCIGLILFAAIILILASVAGGELWDYLKDTFFASTTPPSPTP